MNANRPLSRRLPAASIRRDHPAQRYCHVLMRAFTSWLVISLSLLTVPCCALFGSAYAAPGAADVQHVDDHEHDSGHGHPAPDSHDGCPVDHCDHWVDSNPFLIPQQALLAQSVESPVWYRTAISELELLEMSVHTIGQPSNARRRPYPRFYLLYAHLLL